MPDINDYRDSFSRKLDDLRNQSPKDQPVTASISVEMAGQVAAWEANLETALKDYYRLGSPADQMVQPEPARQVERGIPIDAWSAALDKMIFEELEFSRYPVPSGFTTPFRWVENEAELRQVACQACGVETVPDGVLKHGVFHAPGQGTYINRTLYENTGLGDNKLQRANYFGELAWERWGWGFLLEYTALGRAAGSAGLWPALSANRLGLTVPDEVAAGKAAALRRSWMFLEAGWSEWIWQFVEYKARRAVGTDKKSMPRPGRLLEMIDRIVSVFPMTIDPFGIRIRVLGLLDLVKFLFFEQTDIMTEGVHQALIKTHELCLLYDLQIEAKLGIRLSQVLGRLYFSQLETAVGIMSIPYAVLIIMHVPSLPGLPGSNEILEKVSMDLRMSPDTRLAQMARLDARIKYDPRAMFVAAWERFKLEGPREFFH